MTSYKPFTFANERMDNNLQKVGAIGVFDSGYGGLTILKEFVTLMPEYDYVYLGDNARTPYGTRSQEVIYQYTLECVQELFNKGCHLVILACNTASAKALRRLQQTYLPTLSEYKRVLGIVRPTSEVAGNFTTTKHIGILGTKGTVNSEAYPIEVAKFFPDINIHQLACPMWVPLVENLQHNKAGADYFVKEKTEELLSLHPSIDAVVLGCTHYPLLYEKIRKYLPKHIQIINQGTIVAHSLKDYLQRHPTIDKLCNKNSHLTFLTTDDVETFKLQATEYFGTTIEDASHVTL